MTTSPAYPDDTRTTTALTAVARTGVTRTTPTPRANPGRQEEIEALALAISVFPVVGLLGGLLSAFGGKPRNGGLMMVIGFASLVFLAVLVGV